MDVGLMLFTNWRRGEMKKQVLLLVAVLSLFSIVGCTSSPAAPTGTAAEIVDKIFTQAGVEPFGMSQQISDENMEFYLGSLDYPELADSMVVMPMINLDTRVLYIIKATNKGDVEMIKTKLEENIDPNKLVCVTFSMGDVVIESRGDIIFMTINSGAEQRTALTEAFKTIE